MSRFQFKIQVQGADKGVGVDTEVGGLGRGKRWRYLHYSCQTLRGEGIIWDVYGSLIYSTVWQ